MILEHLGKSPVIDPTAYVAPNAVVCGDVTVGANEQHRIEIDRPDKLNALDRATVRALTGASPRLRLPDWMAAVERQTYATLFANADGVMIGDGELWFSGTCADAACAEASVRTKSATIAAGV